MTNLELSFDQYQRYKIVEEVIDSLRCGRWGGDMSGRVPRGEKVDVVKVRGSRSLWSAGEKEE